MQHCRALKSAHVSVSGLQGIEESGEDTAFQWVFRGLLRVPDDAEVFASEFEESWTVWSPTTTYQEHFG